MKEVMIQNRFSICPHCGSHMVCLASHFTLYGMTESGKHPNQILATDSDYTMTCPKCGFKAPMVKTVDGLYPRDHYMVKDEEILMNTKPKDKFLIGYIDEKEDN